MSQLKISAVCVNSGMAKLCKHMVIITGIKTDIKEMIIEVIPILKSTFIKLKPNKNMPKVNPIK